MSIDHGRFDVAMAQQFLHGPDVVATFQQVGRKGMPQGLATGGLEKMG